MRFSLVITTLLFALFVEWAWGAKFLIFGFQMPLVILTAIFWFWRMKLSSRLWTAAVVGLISGSLSIYPPAIYIIILAVAAFATEFFHEFFFFKSRA